MVLICLVNWRRKVLAYAPQGVEVGGKAKVVVFVDRELPIASAEQTPVCRRLTFLIYIRKMIYSEYKNMLPRLLTTVFTFLFLGVMLGGLFTVSAGMNMGEGGHMAGCPLMAHGETLCAMNILDHLGAWQANFMALVPTLTLLLGAVTAAGVLFTVAPHLIFSSQKLLYLRRILYRRPTDFLVSVRPLQELFSNGILNPKLF